MSKPGQIVLSEDFGMLRQRVPKGHRVVVLYDRNVQQWMELMVEEQWLLLPLDGGENLKQWVHVEQVLNDFLSRGVDRSWFVVGMGGGTVCDFTGFVASVYMRGLPFGLVPTTLLAQVDAALGGKNGIHLGPYKNTIGCTVLPRWVYCNPLVLETLPREEFRCGLAECIKHAAIADASYFAFIRDQVVPHLQAAQGATPQDPATSKDPVPSDPAPSDPAPSAQAPIRLPLPVFKELIVTSQRIKMAFVEEDMREQGARKALNFGHTFGHALAACRPTIRHGQAVACGMALAAEYAVALDQQVSLAESNPPVSGSGESQSFLTRQEYQSLVDLLKACGLDVELPCPFREIIPYMLSDKKKQGDDLQLVLLSRLGQYVFVKESVAKWRNRSRNPGISLGTGAIPQVNQWLDKAPWTELRLDLMEPLSPIALVALRMQCMGREHRLMLTHPLASAHPLAPSFAPAQSPDKPALALAQPSSTSASTDLLENPQVPPMLAEMLSWGVGWVDIPFDASPAYVQEVTDLARQNGTQIIRSAHFWQLPEQNNAAGTTASSVPDAADSGTTEAGTSGVPSKEVLNSLAARAFAEGADYLKIAVYTRSRQESDALLAWCDRQNAADNRYRVTLMVMGDDALRARRHALRNGYPFVYASVEAGQATAPGQPSFSELDE